MRRPSGNHFVGLRAGLAILACSFAFLNGRSTLAADLNSGNLQIQFAPDGLSSLKCGDSELLVEGRIDLQRLRVASGDIGQGFAKRSQKYDPTTHSIEQSYDWGKIKIVMNQRGDQLLETVEVSNQGLTAITEVGLDLLHLQFPSVPRGTDWKNRYPMTRDRPDEFPVVLANWGTGRLAVCNEDLARPVNFAVWPLQGQPYAIWLWFNKSPIDPGQKRSATISIRLAGSDADEWSIAKDVLQRYAQQYPSQLNWSDRRPIGSAFLSTSVAGYAKSPRGWFMDPAVDVESPAGLDKFKVELSKYEDQVLANCKMMNAQGVIVWDIEGQEMPHATSYLADPRMLSKVAPEMEPLADGFFKRLTDAGLRTGISVRPTRVVAVVNGQGWKQEDVDDPVAEMSSKIDYAQKRWGCTIFYVDSNVAYERDPNGQVTGDPPMAAKDFQTLAQKHPDCLLIPEHKTDQYWAFTAPYGELRLGTSSTPEEVRLAYPRAFSVLRVVDGPSLDDTAAELAASVRAGDVLLFRPWWNDPSNQQIKHIYALSHEQQAKAN